MRKRMRMQMQQTREIGECCNEKQETNKTRRKVKCATMNVKKKTTPSPFLSLSQTYIYRHAGGKERKAMSGRGVGNVELKSLAPISISISIPKFHYHGMQRLRWIMHAECRFPVPWPSPRAPSLLVCKIPEPPSYPTTAHPDGKRNIS
jgi:hypothetical protein